MKGTALLYKPNITTPEITEFDTPVDLEFLQKAVGGFIEIVPRFRIIEYNGETKDCIVFCNEDGKGMGLPINANATIMWENSLPPPGLRNPQGQYVDVLVGNILAVFGDDDFMESL